MGTKKGQRRITYGKNGTPTKKAYPSKKKTKKRTKPSGKKGAIFHTKGGRLRVRWTQDTIDKSVKLGHIFKGWF